MNAFDKSIRTFMVQNIIAGKGFIGFVEFVASISTQHSAGLLALLPETDYVVAL